MSGLCTSSCQFTDCFTHLVTFALHTGPQPHLTHALQDGSERADLPKLHSKEAFLTPGIVGGKLAQGQIQSTILQYYLAYPARYF